ncbi:hypothetical protein N7478_003661 [Penicillium angulare]|uniref:uncharacterized protein n=1 Tax=Penicillium angulare TaxID=116970 RepID=UPI0025400F0F|nr:uncharacterized protein N7478_003661 [Penicillium angulare]KAJ5287975.1 hypothetical protein N7478_003661 [Penicillium angulare]
MYIGKLVTFEKEIFELHSAFGDFGACVAVSIAATHGLGKSDETCTDDSLKKVQLGLYGMEICHTLTIGFAKMSLIALFSLLLSPTQVRKMIIATATFIVLWTLSMLVATTVQCSPLDVWDLAHGSCINTVALWRYFGATNITIETLIFATIIVFVSRLHMKKWTRVMVISCFSVRIMDIAVTGVQLSYTEAFSSRGCALQLDIWPWVMCSQVLQTVTIVSACMPHLRDFLESFPSGMFRLTEMESATMGSRSTLRQSEK